MDRITEGFLTTPHRLGSGYAKGLIVLALFVLVLASLGGALYDGAQRVAYVSAIGAIGLSNLSWGIGSLLPDEKGGLLFRNLVRSFSLVMLIALPIALYFQFRPGA